MKKIVLIFAMLSMFVSLPITTTGQGSEIAAVELSVSPFTYENGERSEAWLRPGYFKARLLTDLIGVRVGFGTDMFIGTDQEHQPESVVNITSFDIRPGIEFYPVRVDGALPFIGIDFIYSMRDTHLDTKVGAPIIGALDIDNLDQRGFTAYGANLVVGGDYYLEGGGFFIGTEIGFEYLFFNHHEVKWGDEVRAPATTSTLFRPTLRSSIRIGVAF